MNDCPSTDIDQIRLGILASTDVRALKGAPLAILWLCLQDPQAHSAKWYERNSGYSNATITRALDLLIDRQIFARISGGWALATNKQMILSTDLESYPQPVDKNHKIYDSKPLVVNSSLINIDTNNNDLTTTNQGNHKNYDLILKTCHDLGIHDPKATEFARRDIDPGYIKGHVQAQGVDLPLAIWRIQNNRPLPKEKETQSEYIACDICGALFLPFDENNTICGGANCD